MFDWYSDTDERELWERRGLAPLYSDDKVFVRIDWGCLCPWNCQQGRVGNVSLEISPRFSFGNVLHRRFNVANMVSFSKDLL